MEQRRHSTPPNRRTVPRCRRDWLVTKQAIQESQLEDKLRGLSEHDLQLLKIHMSQCEPPCQARARCHARRPATERAWMPRAATQSSARLRASPSCASGEWRGLLLGLGLLEGLAPGLCKRLLPTP
jgi:hypothetical protein